MIDRNARNYDSLRKFCVSRDSELTEILDKVPQWKESTNFNQIFSTAITWAKCPEEDRIKFFLAYLMPSSIKDKIKERYDETIEVFRRKGQVIWNAYKEDALQPAKPVNYDRTRRSEPTQYGNKNNYYNYNRNYQHHQQNFNHRNNNLNYAKQRKNVVFCNFAQVKRQPPICRYYRLGICYGGESGVENGFVCKFKHPKLCKNFCEYGHDHKLGCAKSRKCNYYHPKICHEAWHLGKCFDTNCSLRHLKSTNRKINSVFKTAIHKAVDKTVKNYTKSPKSTIKAVNDEIRPEINKTVKVCSMIKNTTNDKADLIDIKEKINLKPIS